MPPAQSCRLGSEAEVETLQLLASPLRSPEALECWRRQAYRDAEELHDGVLLARNTCQPLSVCCSHCKIRLLSL